MKVFFQRAFLIFITTLAISFAGCATPRPEPKFSVTVNWDTKWTPSKKESAIWLGYLLARANYINAHEDMYIGISGVCVPRFEEEVDARTKAAHVYGELSAKDKELRDDYFEDVLKADHAGFMKEYVWTYLRQSTWPESESPLNLLAFNSWKETNLKDHQPVTHGSISIRSK